MYIFLVIHALQSHPLLLLQSFLLELQLLDLVLLLQKLALDAVELVSLLYGSRRDAASLSLDYVSVLDWSYHVLLQEVVGIVALAWDVVVVLGVRLVVGLILKRSLAVVVQKHLFVGTDAFVW